MQAHIASCLFQYGRVSLPGLGALAVKPGAAVSDFINRKIYAPVPETVYSTVADDEGHELLLSFFSEREGSSRQQAATAYSNWLQQVTATLQKGGQVQLPGVGSFSGGVGSITFTQQPLPDVFFPAVQAERVVHPEAEHPMLVGEKETTNVEMTDYFAATPAARSRWWLWALLPGLLAAGVIAYQLTARGVGVLGTGNACIISAPEPPVLYGTY